MNIWEMFGVYRQGNVNENYGDSVSHQSASSRKQHMLTRVWGKGSSDTLLVGAGTRAATVEISLEVTQKNWKRKTVQPTGIQVSITQRCTHICVYCCTLHSSQDGHQHKWRRQVVYITVKLDSAVKKNEIMSFAGKGTELESIMLSELSHHILHERGKGTIRRREL